MTKIKKNVAAVGTADDTRPWVGRANTTNTTDVVIVDALQKIHETERTLCGSGGLPA